LKEELAEASPDLLRELLTTFVNALLSAQADSVCGADYGVRSQDRVNRRNGYRARELDTRVGTVEVAIPKLREGSYFPDWLLERRRRAEAALTTVVATSYLLGVSTRRMDRLVKTLGITGLSKSQVSEMAKDLDTQVAAFRTRPLDAGPYTFLARSSTGRVDDEGPGERPGGQRRGDGGHRDQCRRLPGDPRRPHGHNGIARRMAVLLP
jgi:transposase-like protein